MSNVSGVTPTEADCCRTISNFCWSFRRHLSDSHFLGELDPLDPYQLVGVTAWLSLCLSTAYLCLNPSKGKTALDISKSLPNASIRARPSMLRSIGRLLGTSLSVKHASATILYY